MALDKSDLKAIEQIVDKRVGKSEVYLKDYVEFAIEKSEMRVKSELGGQIQEIKGDMGTIKKDIKEINRNMDDLIETNQTFLGYFNNHETRITHVEKKLGIKPV